MKPIVLLPGDRPEVTQLLQYCRLTAARLLILADPDFAGNTTVYKCTPYSLKADCW